MAAQDQDEDEEKKLSAFLETFPTPLLHSKPESYFKPWVFWNKEVSQNNPSSGENVNYSADVAINRMICDKIKSAFSLGRYCMFSVILQLWVPVKIGGMRVLSTSCQPFAVNDLDNNLAKYRLRSLEYSYIIDETNNNLDIMIINGAASSVFLNRLSEIVYFEQLGGSLLDRYALESGLQTCYMLPICCPSQSTSSCVGVIECSTTESPTTWIIILNTIKNILEKVGLSVFSVQERIPYKNINGLKPVKDEIEDALKIVCESHSIGLAQVWISYEDENHVPLLSSLEDTRKKRMLALKLTGYILDDDPIEESFQDYSHACDMLPLHTGKEIVEKTFQDYEPRFCTIMWKLGPDMLMARAQPYDEDCESSALVICLRSINTGHFNYVFEFIWHYNSNYVILLESVLLTIKSCLPSFKFASGGELGHELDVIDVDYSPTSKNQMLKIFQGKKVPPIPEVSKKGKKQMVEDYMEHSEEKRKTAEIKFRKEAAKNLKGNWKGPNVVKRKVNDSNNNQSKTNEKDDGALQDPLTINRNEDTLTIKAEYADDIIKFRLSISEATFKTVEKEIGMQFNLTIGTFKLKYKDDDGDWILLKTDQHMSDCIESWRNSDGTVVRLRVLPTAQQL